MSWFRRRKRPQKHTDDTGRANSSTLPQELVDEFLSYLDDPTDLRLTSANLQACALVCRSWSTTAQRLLFKMVYLFNTHRFRRLEKTLRSSLHLVPHIRILILDRGLAAHVSLKIQAFEKICQFPFTHLKSVSLLDLGAITHKSTIALQQLFSLPTLRRIGLNTASFEPLQFPALWARCSSSVRHLQLRCRSRFGSAFRPTLRHSAPIALASLRLDTMDGVDEWLHHDLCPFDFSRLAVLSVTSRTTALRRPRMAAALKTIEALELIFVGFVGGEPVNLSKFSNLHFLRIHFSSPSDHQMGLVLESLSTLTSASPIRQIVMHFSPLGWSGEEACDPFDAKMAGLELVRLASVGLEMDIHEYTRTVPFFPRLHSKNLLSRTDDGWFERHIRRNESLG